ncbi:MAG TPA: class I tRNA ligase family protein, partial [Alphaproteobacteria bacterium]|nr:class I tRNA ligase family protein [Alphaproteobacteria bacterium]
YGDRSNTVVEPFLTDQWFLDAKKLAIPALEAVKSGKTSFFPELWTKTYYEWLENIEPWCISRQIWWGHQVPAWFTKEGEIFVAKTEKEAYEKARQKLGQDVVLTRDEDVLDTWFSSALWPFSTLGWPQDCDHLKKFYPTSVLVTGFDIIFFWVARMMMMGLYFKKEIPFKTIYIHALVRDEKGAKMSKSKGNVINPLEIIDEFGADALRFTMSLLCVPGRDVKLGKSRVELTRNFTTKIWNAAKFLEHYECQYDKNFDPSKVQNTLQQWILIKLQEVSLEVKKSLDSYRFDEASKALYHFIWGTYCDIYLEFLKPIFQSNDENLKLEAKNTAIYVFVEALKLFHPFTPFITDELYQHFTKDNSAHLIESSWPDFTCPKEFETSFRDVEHAVQVLENVRSLRALYKVAPQEKVPFIQVGNHGLLAEFESVLLRLARLESIKTLELLELKKTDVQLVVEGHVYALSLEGLIEPKTEKERLSQDLKKLEKDLNACEARLNNTDFMSRAKEEVIDEMKDRQISLSREIALIKNAITFLS